MTDEIFIPEEALLHKPWWTQRPNEERIKEILAFIGTTAKPHLWPGQTYNRPDGDTLIDYLAIFELPASKPLAPCPCCTPRHGKYRHGVIAYFPNECTIRIMGHNCFESINSEKHVEALKKYHAGVRRKQDIAYLLGHLDKVPELIRVAEHAAPIGHAVDEFRHETMRVFKETFRVDLWDHIKEGTLRISESKKQVVYIPGHGEEERDVHVTETFGQLAGQSFLRPKAQRTGLRLDHIVIGLQRINFGHQFAEHVADMSDQDRAKAAKILGNAMKTATTVFAEISDMRQFTRPETIGALNRWAAHPACPVHFHLSYDGSSLYVGKNEYESRRVVVPPEYQLALKPLPRISAKTAVA